MYSQVLQCDQFRDSRNALNADICTRCDLVGALGYSRDLKPILLAANDIKALECYTHTHTCAIRIKISVLCVLNLHSILIAKKCTQSQLVPRCKGVRKEPNERTEERTNLCAIKRQNTARDGGGQQRQRLRESGRAGEAKANLRSLSKGSDVAYLIFFSVFYLFMLCHHHCQPGHRRKTERERETERRAREQVEWSILFLRERGGERGHECAVRSTTN